MITWGAVITLLSPLFAVTPALAACCVCQDSSTNKSMCLTILKGGCATVQKDYISNNPDISTVTCSGEISNTQCKTIATGGVCAFVADASLYSNTTPANSSINALTPPELEVKIPGLSFTTDPRASGGDLQISFLAQYISAAYKYLVGVSIIAAAIMIVFGGIKYIIGSSATSISTGKEVIGDAIIGLFLVLGTFTILNTLNTNITNPKSLSVRLVNRQDASMDAETDKQRVTESAVVRPSPRNESAVVAEDSPNLGTPEGTPPPTTQLSPGSTPRPNDPAPGTTATNPQGGFIAQGSCPDGMLPIPYSEEYEAAVPRKGITHAAHVNSFCMDVFEAPSVQGQMPYIVNDWEADWYCRDHGKRLCTTSEWVRACLGPKAENTFGYGPTFIKGKWVNAKKPASDPQWYKLNRGGSEPGPCNYDTPGLGSPSWGKLAGYASFTAEESILNKNNPKLADPKIKARYDAAIAEINRLNGSEPSGARSGCITQEGIVDMTGNLAEVTVKDKFSNKTTDQRVALGPRVASAAKPYDWRGFYWNPRPHQAGAEAEPSCLFSAGGPHHAGSGWRDYANGFRCCLDLAESR